MQQEHRMPLRIRPKMGVSFWTDTERQTGLCCGICKEIGVQALSLYKHVGKKKRQEKWELLGRCVMWL